MPNKAMAIAGKCEWHVTNVPPLYMAPEVNKGQDLSLWDET